MRVPDWLLLASVMAACVPVPTDTNYQSNSIDLHQPYSRSLLANQKSRTVMKRASSNQRRQTQPSFLYLVGRFFGQTFSDTNQAFRNITKIFNDQFTTTTPSPDMTTEEDSNSTTEKPPTPITRERLFSILGGNYRGLVRLFDSEWQAAIEQSGKNVENFRKELREAVKPYFSPNKNLTLNKS